MTQEEKAQAYDKAVEVIRKFETDKYGCVIGIKPSDLFQELRESDDERIRKALLNEFIHLQSKGYKFAGLEGEEIVAWLEKQGEQKPADKVAPKFKVGDWVVYNRNDHSREVIQIYDIRDNRYYFNDNIHFSWSVKECDEKCHLWTIDDVKDGDVVAQEPFGTYEKPFVAIYKGRGLDHFVSYCFTSFDGKFNEGTGGHCLNVHPATKEQCEQLEKAMTEAGYTFDFDKKELKKSEQNSNWSEEDEDMLQSILDEYKSMTTEKRNWLKSIKDIVQPQTKQEWSEEDEKIYNRICDIVHSAAFSNCEVDEDGKEHGEYAKMAELLKSLKERVLPQLQQEWSKEDEKMVESLHGWLDTLVNYIHDDAIVSLDLRRERMQQVERLKTWLELLKDKVGNFDNGYKVGFSAAKHNQWKPSDVQMRILSIYADQNNTHGAVLTSLYQDLKKLK